MKPATSRPLDVRNERGMALVVALLSVMLLTALGVALVMTTITETMITTNYREGGETVYAADAGVERVMQDLLTISDWNRILQGASRSSFVDGAPGGVRVMPDKTSIDLQGATNMLNCGKTTTCSLADMQARTPDRPYAANNPRYQLFAYSPLNDIIETETVASNTYVIVWIGDDTAETDNDPLVDGGAPQWGEVNTGTGVLLLRAEAYGAQGAHSIIEVTIARTDTTELERGYTGQRGQDEQNRRARKAGVQVKQQALTRSDLSIGSNTGGFVVR
jgi:hypothetical protein